MFCQSCLTLLCITLPCSCRELHHSASAVIESMQLHHRANPQLAEAGLTVLRALLCSVDVSPFALKVLLLVVEVLGAHRGEHKLRRLATAALADAAPRLGASELVDPFRRTSDVIRLLLDQSESSADGELQLQVFVVLEAVCVVGLVDATEEEVLCCHH